MSITNRELKKFFNDLTEESLDAEAKICFPADGQYYKVDYINEESDTDFQPVLIVENDPINYELNKII